jgi:hypothetical protein
MLTPTAFLRVTPCVLIFFITHTLCAEDASEILARGLAKHWQVLKSLSLDVAHAFPEKAYTPKAAIGSRPNEMRPSELGGLALENVLSCSIALGTPAPARFQSAFERPMDSTKTGVIMNLTVAYDFCIDGLSRTKDTDLFKTSLRGYKGHSATRFDIFWDAYARATYFLGKAEVYLHLNGIAPPEVGPKFDF